MRLAIPRRRLPETPLEKLQFEQANAQSDAEWPNNRDYGHPLCDRSKGSERPDEPQGSWSSLPEKR